MSADDPVVNTIRDSSHSDRCRSLNKSTTDAFASDSHSVWFEISVGKPSKCRQRFVDAIDLISDSDWSERLSNFENVNGETQPPPYQLRKCRWNVSQTGSSNFERC